MLNKLPAGHVINFSDIYEETFDGYVDKKFKLSYVLLPVVFLAMVHTGNAVIAINGGKTITASDLETIAKTLPNATDLYDFKYISKPKDIQLPELVHLFEVLDAREGYGSIAIIAQIPVASWYEIFRNSVYADACLSRMANASYRLEFDGSDRRQEKKNKG